jgi:hypothetical protein
MTTTTSTVPAFLEALRGAMNARFAANPDFTEVKCFAAPAGDPLPLEMIEFVGTDSTQVWAAISNRRKAETYTVRGMVGTSVEAGAGEDVADQARARAYALLAELEDQLRTDINMVHTVYRCALASANLTQWILDNGRAATLEITIDVYTELNS